MNALEHLDFFWDAQDAVLRRVLAWRPTDCVSEKDFERSLVEQLRATTKARDIVPQYGHGRNRLDIVIGKVGIELKANLTSTNEYHRLLGQISEYQDWQGPLVLLVAGEFDDTFFRGIKKAGAARPYGTGFAFVRAQNDESPRVLYKTTN